MKGMTLIIVMLATTATLPGPTLYAAGVHYLVPAVARVPGEAGSLWRSDLVVHNSGGAPVAVRLQYLVRDRANPSPSERSFVVDPGVSVLAEDLLSTLFGIEHGAGALLIIAESPVELSSRTFNLTTSGCCGLEQTWGQFVPGIPVDTFAATSLHLLPQLTDDGAYRTNLGIVNLGYDELLAWVDPTVFGGEDPKARIFRVPEYGMRQVNGPLAETGAPVDDAMISVDTDFLSGPFLAWASVVDNRSGDAVFIPPIRPLGGEVYIPGAAHVDGLNGTLWRTDLEITGDPHLPVAYRLEWLPADTDNSNPSGLEFTLEPGRARRHRDVVGDDLASTGAGAIRVTMLVGHALVTSRTYTVTDAGSFGQFVAGRPAAAATTFGGKSVLVHLRQSADVITGYRSNVGVVSTSPAPVDVVVDCCAADGAALGAISFTLPPFAAHQVNRILAELAPEGVDLASAVVTTTTAGGSFLAYASVIDNRSNDPIFVPGQ